MVASTVSRSSVELTAWLTSPSARSSPTDRVSSRVRASSSWNSRTFSIAITAWSAKVSSRATCRSVKSRTSVRRRAIAPIATPFSHQGDAEDRAKAHAPRILTALREFVHFGLARQRRGWSARPAPIGHGIVPRTSGRENSPMGPMGIPPLCATRRHRSPSRRQMAASSDSQRRAALSAIGVEHGLDVGRRARDDAQDLARRRLLLQCLSRGRGCAPPAP